MRLLCCLLLLVASQNALANPTPVKSYEEAKALLGLDKDGQESRTFFGVVNVDADNDNNQKHRYTCMALKFIADDTNKRLDYMYKGWHTRSVNSDKPCEFFNPEPVSFTSQHILCMTKNYPTKQSRHIVMEDVAKAHGDQLNLRGLDLSTLDTNGKGSALTRCNRSIPLPAGSDPVAVAPLHKIEVVNEVIQGSEAKGPQRTLKIRLDLSKVNPGMPMFEKVDYLILLDKHPADIKLALGDSRFAGEFDVDYVEAGPKGFDFEKSAENDIMEHNPQYAHLGPDFKGDMAINFAKILDANNKQTDVAYKFERKAIPAGESDDMTCTGDNTSLPRKLLFKAEIQESLAAIDAALKNAANMPAAKVTELKAQQAKLTGMAQKLETMAKDASLAQQPLGYILGKKCIAGQVDADPLVVPIMKFEVSDDLQKLEMGAFLGQFRQQPIMGFSHYYMEREKPATPNNP